MILEPGQKEPSHPRLTQQIFPERPWSPLGSTRISFLRASPPPGTSGDIMPRPSDSLNVFNGASRPKESRASAWDAIYGEVNGPVDAEPLDSPSWIFLLAFAPGCCRELGSCTKITWRNDSSSFLRLVTGLNLDLTASTHQRWSVGSHQLHPFPQKGIFLTH